MLLLSGRGCESVSLYHCSSSSAAFVSWVTYKCCRVLLYPGAEVWGEWLRGLGGVALGICVWPGNPTKKNYIHIFCLRFLKQLGIPRLAALLLLRVRLVSVMRIRGSGPEPHSDASLRMLKVFIGCCLYGISFRVKGWR